MYDCRPTAFMYVVTTLWSDKQIIMRIRIKN